MPLLDRLGLGSRSSRTSRRGPLRLEGRTSEPDGLNLSTRAVWERVGLLAALSVLTLIAYPNVSVYDGTGEIGEIWGSQDVVAPFDFAIRLPPDQIQSRRDSVRRMEPPIFSKAPDATALTIARLDSIDARLDSTFSSYLRWQRARGEEDDAAARRDSAGYVRHLRAVASGIPTSQWRALLRSAVQSDQTGSQPLDDILLGEAARISRELLDQGVVDAALDTIASGQIIIREPDARTERYVQAGDVVDSTRATLAAARSFSAAFPGRPDTVAIGVRFFNDALAPSLEYQEGPTLNRIEQRVDAVLPTEGLVRENFTIIRTGDEVTPKKYRELESLREAQRERSGNVSWVRIGVGRLILIVATIALYFLYLYLLRPVIFADTRKMLMLCLLLAISLVGYFVAALMVNVADGAAAYAVPVALTTVLLTIVFDSRVGSFAAITLSLLSGLIFGFSFQVAFVTLVVGILAVFSVRDVKNRSQLLATAGLVLVSMALLLFAFDLLRAAPFTDRLNNELAAAPIHAISLLLAGPILLVLERVFRVTTDITLLELSDTNRPLLKELSLRAPGTFNHSLQVANLAEAAADAIGANALRTRVGALYHDIGKMRKPEYFIENQQPGENPHEKLKPSMSTLVIAAHVKDGLELGREYNLPQVVVDFIGSHHGTSLMEFFYRRAQEMSESEVDEAEFRYPGPRPRTNEQAIVMLADSVEAASRSLDKPTPKKLETLIDGIFSSRVADGQLDQSGLTFSDLTTIKETFHSLLCGIYHFRVKYPDQEPEPGGAQPDPAAPAEAEEEVRPTSEERSTLG